MKTAGIVCEYNPFHKGHAYQIEKTKDAGASHIIAVMSGNYVQRGDISVLPKEAKAQAAVDGGADLVLELPVVWAMSSAESFAKGAVSVLKNTGVTDFISFGSESGDKTLLQNAADAVNDARIDEKIKEYLDGGISFVAARARAINELFGDEIAAVLASPNDILGIEYLNAIKGSNIEPMVIRRFEPHDRENDNPFRKSSSEIRDMIMKGNEAYKKALPLTTCDVLREYAAIGKFPVFISNIDRAIMAVLRRLEPEDFLALPDVSEGLEYKIFNAVKQSSSVSEILLRAKSKRYTMARIRRIILSAYLGINKGLSRREVPYLRVLAMNEKGKELLKEMKEKAKAPVIMKYADIKNTDEFCNEIFNTEARATDLYSLAFDKPSPCGAEMTTAVYVARK